MLWIRYAFLCVFLLWLSCSQAQQSGMSCSALGMALPEGQNAWQAMHFPQGSANSPKRYHLGVAFENHPQMPFARLRQLGIYTSKGPFQWAAYASFYGNALYGWQQYQGQSGVNMGKWRLGVGLWTRRLQIAELHHWHFNMQLGASGRLHPRWNWHLAFEQLRQGSIESHIELGLPPATARLLLEHRAAESVRIWLMYQQQLQWKADFGLGMQWQIHPRIQLDLAIAPPYRRYSLGLVVQHQDLRLALQARHQALPGLWWGNQVQWSTPLPP